MKKMKLSLAIIILTAECYKRKCKNVSKLLNLVKNQTFSPFYSKPRPHHRSPVMGKEGGCFRAASI